MSSPPKPVAKNLVLYNVERVFDPLASRRRRTRDSMPKPFDGDLSLDHSRAKLPITYGIDLQQHAQVSTYEYQPLREGEIRLLQFREESDTRSISAKLIHVDLQSAAKSYIAISYCWGPKDTSRCLSISDNTVLAISQTVEDLLQHIVSGEVTSIWIDAICINQVDDKDKNQQIRLMRDIYTAASETVAWLGQPSAPDKLWRYLHSYDNNLSWRDHVDDILEVLSAPWFGRVWVIQEVGCSESIRVLFGGISMSWDYFCDLNFYLNESGVMNKILHDSEFVNRREALTQAWATPAYFVRFLMIVRASIQNAAKESDPGSALNPLDSFLLDTRLHKATDPRDKVYSLLGIVKPASRHLLFADYANDSVDSAFREAACLCYCRGRLALLGLCGTAIPRKSVKYPFTPSWVPDLTVTLPGTVWSSRYDDYDTSWARAPAIVRMIEKQMLHQPPPGTALYVIPLRLLSIVGGIADTIAGISTEPPLAKPDLNELCNQVNDHSAPVHLITTEGDYRKKVVRETMELCKRTQPYPSGAEYTPGRICWKTLTADLDGTHGRADASFFDEAFKVYRRMEFGEVEDEDALEADAREKHKGKDTASKEPEHSGNAMTEEEFQAKVYEVRVMHARIERAMSMAAAGVHRRVFWTKRGYVGLATVGIQEGDSVMLLRGACVPFILRHADMCGCGGSGVGPVLTPVSDPLVVKGEDGSQETSEGGEKEAKKCVFKIVCEAYVCGMMDDFSPADAKETILVW
ncbi:heterokaryon incompatibility protein-domain-containing protein [Immersiella caudata]|uniref:Heterokaryon incompatibility protein-domain-containing protein n=1 Tax=Immersiella caudata TaxID=314043 RepID=A0AA39WJR8_9PEZI|nr:heterokaryon incompatibility protein-domain-containing protein [Immersiella caudata]